MRRIAKWFNRPAAKRMPQRWLQPETLEDRSVPAAFTPGDLVLLRIGDGSNSLVNSATAGALVELTTAGANPSGGANVINLPNSASANNTGGITYRGSTPVSAGLALSQDGRYLTTVGYDAQLGTASVEGTSSASANRNVARIDSAGSISIVGRLTDAFDGKAARGVISPDGTGFYISGETNGLRYFSYGGSAETTSKSITASVTNRMVSIVGGNVVTATATAISRYNGLPTSGPVTPTNIGATINDSGQFVFLDRDAGVGDPNLDGADTLYVANGNAPNAIAKYFWNGSTWTAAGVATLTGGTFGMVGTINGSNVDLYVTTASLSNNSLFKFTDTAAYNSNIAGSFGSALVSAGANFSFRGIAWAPSNGPSVTFVSATTANGSYKAGSIVDVTVKFTQAVSVTGTPQLTLETGSTDRVVDYVGGDGTDTLTFRYTVQAGDNTGDLDYTNTTALSLNGGTISNAGLNASLTLAAPGATGSLGANKAIVIDTTPPTVTNVTSSTADGSYRAGQSVTIDITFSESVNVTGNPQLLLETGAVDHVATFTSRTGNTASFTYTVTAGDTSPDLDYTGTTALSLNGGTIRDIALNDATLTLPAPGNSGSLGANKAIKLDTTKPTITSVTAPSGTYKLGTTITISVLFSESVSMDNTNGDPTLALAGMAGAATFLDVNLNVLRFQYTVQSTDFNADLNATSLALNGATIRDAAGNDATLTLPGGANSLAGTSDVKVDGIAPDFAAAFSVVGGSPNNSYAPQFLVKFTEAVTGLDAGDFILTNPGGGVFGASIASIAPNGSSTTDFLVTLNAGSGDGVLQLDFNDNDSVKDLAGNPFRGTGTGTVTGTSVLLDHQDPVFTGFTLLDPSPTNAGSVRFRLTFSEPVTGLAFSDLGFFTTGSISSPSFVSLTGNAAGDVYTVTVNTGTGSGLLLINITNNPTIRDAAGNSFLGGAGNVTINSSSYNLDRTVPLVQSITAGSANPSNASSVAFTVKFTESVSGVDTADFSLVPGGGVSTASITNVSGSGDTWTVTANTGTGTGTLGLNLTDNDTILDGVGNKLGGTGAINGDFTGFVYTIDKTVPVVNSITRASSNPSNAAQVNYLVTFSENVTGVDAADFDFTLSGVSGASVTGVSADTGSTRVITVNTGSGDGTLLLNLRDNNSIIDAAGNILGGAGTQDFTTGQTYTLDKSIPLVQSITLAAATPTNASSVVFNVAFTESVTGVDAGDFSLVTALSGAGITNVSGTGAAWQVTVNTGTGDGLLGLKLLDNDTIMDIVNPLGGPGAVNGDFTGPTSYFIDKTRPGVTVSRATPGQAPATPTQPIPFLIVFTEPVNSFTSGNIALSGTAIHGGESVTSNNPSGDRKTFEVSVFNLTSDGTVIVSVAANATKDDAGNFNLADVSTISTVLYDSVSPSVLNIAPAGNPVTHGATAKFSVQFSEPVTGVATTDFSLVETGITGSTVASVAQDANPNFWIVTVNVGSVGLLGTVRLDLSSIGSIVDAGNNALTGTRTGDQALSIDRIKPVPAFETVSSPRITPLTSIKISFNEPVSTPIVSDFSLTRNGQPVSLSGATISVTTVGTVFTLNNLDTAADGVYDLLFMSGGSVTDAGGNSPVFDTLTRFTVDATGPTATVVEPTAGPINSNLLDYTVTFSEPVFGLDIVNFTLQKTGSLPTAAVTALAPTADPKVYIVSVNPGAGVGTVRVVLSGTPAIKDEAGNTATGLPATSGPVSVDTVAPAVSIDDGDADNAVRPGDVLNYTIDVTDANPGSFVLSRFNLSTSGTAAISIGTMTSAAIAGGTRYSVPITAVTGGTIRLSISASASFADAAGNATSLPLADDTTVTVDAAPPTVTVGLASGQSAATTTLPARFAVTFNEAVAAFTSSNVTLTGTLGNIAGATIDVTNPLSDKKTYIVAVSGLTGNGTVQLTVAAAAVTDLVGNPNIASTVSGTNIVTLDLVPPTVSSIVRNTPLAPFTNATQLVYTVTFSEPVTGVDSADFSFSTTGVLGTTVANVSGGGDTYLVTVNTGSGDGTIRLNVTDNDTIKDAAGNKLGGTGGNNGNFSTGEVYTVDRSLPAVQSITRLDPAITNLSTVRYLVAFTEPVQVSTVDVADFALVTSGVTVGTVAIAQVNAGANDNQFTVTVQGVSGAGTVKLNVNGGSATILDGSGNALTASINGPTYTIDQIGPTVSVNQLATQADPTPVQPLRFRVVFSEPVGGFGPAQLAFSGTATPAPTIIVTNPLLDLKTYEVSVSGLTGDGTVTLNVNAGAVSDTAGNLSAAATFTDNTVTIDTVAPAVSMADLVAASDSGSSSTDDITKITTPTFTGTAEAGSTVTLMAGTTVLGTDVASGGTWFITSSLLADGIYNVFARATDAAGNIKDSSFLPVTIDTAGPTATVTRAGGQTASATATGTSFTARFAITFSQAVASLNASQLSVGGTAGGTIANISGSGASRIVTVGNLTGPGSVTVNVNAGFDSDAAGNAGVASPAGEQVAVSFTTQTLIQVSPSSLTAGGTATAKATVSAPAGGTPGGSVLFTLTGPAGVITRTVALTAGSATTDFTSLAAGNSVITAAYQPAAGYLTSNTGTTVIVAGTAGGGVGITPVDQNDTGEYAGVAGRTVTLFNPDGSVKRTLTPFTGAEAPGGVRAVVADINGDGTPDVAAVTGPGAVARLRVFDGVTGNLIYSKTLFEADFRGGARAAIGDINGDGINDILVSAGFGGGPRVAGYNGATGQKLFNDFFLFEPALRNGAYVSIGDLNGDGFGDIIGGGGPGGAPRVLALDSKALIQNGQFIALANFFAGDTGLRGGVRVAAKDYDGDGKADLVTGSGDTGDMLVFFNASILAGDTNPARATSFGTPLDGVYVG